MYVEFETSQNKLEVLIINIVTNNESRRINYSPNFEWVGDTTRKNKYEGWSVGLPVCRFQDRVEKHNFLPIYVQQTIHKFTAS